MDFLGALQLVATIVVAVWGIYQIRVTKKLEQEVHRLNIGLDQSILLLHRAREAVIQRHKALMFARRYQALGKEPTESYLTTEADWSAHDAELRGLAHAIGDEQLLKLVDEGNESLRQQPNQQNIVADEMTIRNRSQRLHTRISELLEATTQ